MGMGPWEGRSSEHSARRSRIQPRDLIERQNVYEYGHRALDAKQCAVAVPNAELMVSGWRKKRPQPDPRTQRCLEQSGEGAVAACLSGLSQATVRASEFPGQQQAVDVRRAGVGGRRAGRVRRGRRERRVWRANRDGRARRRSLRNQRQATGPRHGQVIGDW